MDVTRYEKIQALKRELGLVRQEQALASFAIQLPERSVVLLRELSCNFVTALTKMAYGCFVGKPPFPTMAELGYDDEHLRFHYSNPPRSCKEMLVMGRLDMTTDGERFTTYEFNGAQPGGLEFISLFMDPLFGDISGQVQAQVHNIYRLYLQNALDYYQNKMQREEPRGILILSNDYHLVSAQHAAYARYLQREIFVQRDSANLSLDERGLYLCDQAGKSHRIDLILRSPRANVKDLRSPENRIIAAAWAQEKAVLVNPPCSNIVGNKVLYAHLQRTELQDAAELSAPERAAIARILPAVCLVTAENKKQFLDDREQWVLKHAWGGRGYKVWLGREISSNEWQTKIEQAALEKGWVCQGFQAPYALPIRLHDVADTAMHVPTTVDPYVTIGREVSAPGFLCRSVIPKTDDPAEIENVKLNLMGTNTYIGSDGGLRERLIGFGYIDSYK